MLYLPSTSALAGIPLFELLLEPREITVTSAGVRDDVICVVRVFGDDGVVDDTAPLVQEDRKGGRVVWQGRQRRWRQPLEERRDSGSSEAERRSAPYQESSKGYVLGLHHVSDIEETCGTANVVMTCDYNML